MMTPAEETQVVSTRMKSRQSETLGRMADLIGMSKSHLIEQAIAEGVFKMLTHHSRWPLHPAYLAGKGVDCVMSAARTWVMTITDPQPERFVKLVEHEGVRAYWFAAPENGPDLDLNADWSERLEAHRRRMAAHKPEVRTVAAMLANLKSDDFLTRLAAGNQLAFSIGIGLRVSGADELDAEHGVGRDISDLLGRAIAGDAAALDELERIITTDPGQAQSTPTESPSLQRKELKQ